jgi:AraC-like DNA-binding protein
MYMSTHKVYLPHPALSQCVRHYWSLDVVMPSADRLLLQLMADRYPRIVIQCLEGKNALYGVLGETVYPASIKGVTTKHALCYMESRYSHFAVSFYPHALHLLFGFHACEANDTVLDLHHFSAAGFIERMMSAKNHPERVQLMNHFLLKKLDDARQADWRVLDFLHSFQSSYARKLKEYFISERQFERKFSQAVGFTPSYYKRVCRFEHAMLKIQSKQFNMFSDVAHDLGYSDQSYFNREFKLFSGLTPQAFLARKAIVTESGSLLTE